MSVIIKLIIVIVYIYIYIYTHIHTQASTAAAVPASASEQRQRELAKIRLRITSTTNNTDNNNATTTTTTTTTTVPYTKDSYFDVETDSQRAFDYYRVLFRCHLRACPRRVHERQRSLQRLYNNILLLRSTKPYTRAYSQ